jgi:hypothetical protein
MLDFRTPRQTNRRNRPKALDRLLVTDLAESLVVYQYFRSTFLLPVLRGFVTWGDLCRYFYFLDVAALARCGHVALLAPFRWPFRISSICISNQQI